MEELAVIIEVLIDFLLIKWVDKSKIRYHRVYLASLVVTDLKERMRAIQVEHVSSNHQHSKEGCGDRSLLVHDTIRTVQIFC